MFRKFCNFTLSSCANNSGTCKTQRWELPGCRNFARSESWFSSPRESPKFPDSDNHRRSYPAPPPPVGLKWENPKLWKRIHAICTVGINYFYLVSWCHFGAFAREIAQVVKKKTSRDIATEMVTGHYCAAGHFVFIGPGNARGSGGAVESPP